MRNSCLAAFALISLSSCAAQSPPGPVPRAIEAGLLARSTPADGSTVAAPVNRLDLHFGTPVRLLEVTLRGPDGLSPMMVTAAAETTDYQIPLPGMAAGAYRVDWRASAAGRSYQGALSFTVRD